MDRVFIDALAASITKGQHSECMSIIRRYKGDTYKLVSMVYYGYYSLTVTGIYPIIDGRNIESILNCLYGKESKSIVIDMYEECRGFTTIIYKNKRFENENRQLLSSITRKHYHNIGVNSYTYGMKYGTDALFKTVVDHFTKTIGCSDINAVMDIWNDRALPDDFDMNLIRILSIISQLLF
jgi:hypothetical protein